MHHAVLDHRSNWLHGSVIIEQAIVQGHTIHELSLREGRDKILTNLEATPVLGDLTTLDILRDNAIRELGGN
jgi:hypothetical protein